MRTVVISISLWMLCLGIPAIIPNLLGHPDAKASFKSAVAFGPMLALGLQQLIAFRRRRNAAKTP